MAIPSTITEIVATTLKNRSKDIADNVSKGNILLNRLNSKGNVKTADGGVTINQTLEYQTNGTFNSYAFA